jgi:hypothetical protein
MRRMHKTLLSIAASAATLAGCGMIAVATAPEKSASLTRSPQATEADALFWDRFHAGDYAAIPRVQEALQAAYLRDPGDVKTASHIGWIHIWKLSERARLADVPASITDEASLSRKYFAESMRLDPADARLAGFYASATLAEASIHHDDKQTRAGYYDMRAAIRAYPAFNLFTAGYVMSTAPRDSARFAEALGWQWENLDVCIGAKIDRANPDYSPYLRLSTTAGPKRVCWNSTIAPHNFEGFFLNMGDMLVKSGDWRTAQVVYRNARLSPSFAAWPYAAILERRIVAAESNVAAFNAPAAAAADGDRRLMIDTRFSCMGCHQGVGPSPLTPAPLTPAP